MANRKEGEEIPSFSSVTLVAKNGKQFTLRRDWANSQLGLVKKNPQKKRFGVNISSSNMELIAKFVIDAKNTKFTPLPKSFSKSSFREGDIRIFYWDYIKATHIEDGRVPVLSHKLQEIILDTAKIKCRPLTEIYFAKLASFMKKRKISNFTKMFSQFKPKK